MAGRPKVLGLGIKGPYYLIARLQDKKALTTVICKPVDDPV